MSSTYQVRAKFDQSTIVVYQAFSSAIADPAIKHQKLVKPFSMDRMTWVKPSFLWLMERSDWGRQANMERTLAVSVRRKSWDAALSRAVLTTPNNSVSISARDWRSEADKASILVQWDPERAVDGKKLDYKSIQVGIKPSAVKDYVDHWIVKIEDCTQLVLRLRSLNNEKKWRELEALVPREAVYALPEQAALRLVPR